MYELYMFYLYWIRRPTPLWKDRSGNPAFNKGNQHISQFVEDLVCAGCEPDHDSDGASNKQEHRISDVERTVEVEDHHAEDQESELQYRAEDGKQADYSIEPAECVLNISIDE